MSEKRHGTKSEKEATAQAIGRASAALAKVVSIRTRIPSWQRVLDEAKGAVVASPADWATAKQRLAGVDTSLKQAAAALSSVQAPQLLGEHAEFLISDLSLADARWQDALSAATAHNPDPTAFAAEVQAAADALDAALQHTLFLAFLGDVWKAHVGEKRGVADYCQDWGLTPDQVSHLWRWLTTDSKVFGGVPLPVVLDTQNRCAYRKAEGRWKTIGLAVTPLWGFLVALGGSVAFFSITHWAGLTSWPREQWGWKLVVLLLLVSLGAAAHLGSRAIDVNFDDPMKVYDAGSFVDWLSLRWVTVIRLYIPVTLVTILLWGAGNTPTSFQKLGSAFLAGYTADSVLKAALSRLQGKATPKASATPVAGTAEHGAPGAA